MTRVYYPSGGLTVVTCDFAVDANVLRNPETARTARRSCAVDFRSASVRSVLGKQLAHAGWLARPVDPGAGIAKLAGARITLRDLCPEHARSVTQPMSYAERNEANRS